MHQWECQMQGKELARWPAALHPCSPAPLQYIMAYCNDNDQDIKAWNLMQLLNNFDFLEVLYSCSVSVSQLWNWKLKFTPQQIVLKIR